MPQPAPTTIFFAGTDTDVGKTYVASLVAAALVKQGLRVGVYKPVASDCREVDGELIAADAISLWQAAGRPRTLSDVCPQRYRAALSPPAAAAAEGKMVDANLMRKGADLWTDGFDVRIVEGAGGLFSPLADGVLNIDFAQQFDAARLILVAANRLGVIHQVLAGCEGAQQRGVRVRGIILCQIAEAADDSVNTNESEIRRYCKVPVLGSVAYDQSSWSDVASLVG